MDNTVTTGIVNEQHIVNLQKLNDKLTVNDTFIAHALDRLTYNLSTALEVSTVLKILDGMDAALEEVEYFDRSMYCTYAGIMEDIKHSTSSM